MITIDPGLEEWAKGRTSVEGTLPRRESQRERPFVCVKCPAHPADTRRTFLSTCHVRWTPVFRSFVGSQCFQGSGLSLHSPTAERVTYNDFFLGIIWNVINRRRRLSVPTVKLCRV